MSTRLLGALALACAAWAQSPSFEVASVKLSEPITPELVNSGRLQMGVTIDSKYVRIRQLSLRELTALAYQLKAGELSAPEWMNTARYDIEAKLPEGASRGQVPAMVQTLLAQRFGMKTRRESREMRVYALVTGKNRPRLKAAAHDAPDVPSGQIKGGIAVGAGGSMASIGPGGDSKVTPGPNGNLHIETKAMTMARFASSLNRYCDLPVVDKTGLEGAYEFEFDVTGDEVRNAARAHGAAIRTPPADVASDPSGPSLRDSLEKLGLRLEARKLPVDVLVVDHSEKVPTEN